MRSIVIASLVLVCFSYRVVSCSKEETTTPYSGTTPLVLGTTEIPDVNEKDVVIETDTDGSDSHDGQSSTVEGPSEPLSDPTLPPIFGNDVNPETPELTPGTNPNPSSTEKPTDAGEQENNTDVGPDPTALSVVRPCVHSWDCDHALKEACVPDGDSDFVCGCEQGFVRNKETKICEPSADGIDQDGTEDKREISEKECECGGNRARQERSEELSTTESTEIPTEPGTTTETSTVTSTETGVCPGTPTETEEPEHSTSKPSRTSTEKSTETPTEPAITTEESIEQIYLDGEPEGEAPIRRQMDSKKPPTPETTTATTCPAGPEPRPVSSEF